MFHKSILKNSISFAKNCNSVSISSFSNHLHHHQFTNSTINTSFIPLSNPQVSNFSNKIHNNLEDARLNKNQKKKQTYEQFITKDNLDVENISLNTLTYVPGAKKKKKQLGRGIGSGRGKTSTRGHKGQRARTSVNIPNAFEGGQSPLHRVIPKYGFNNKRFGLDYEPVSLESIQYMIDCGRIDPTEGTITMKTLFDAGVIKNVRYPGIKLLSTGKEFFNAKVDIEVPRASIEAIKAIEKNGGCIKSIYYGKKALHGLLHPEKLLNKGVSTVTMSLPPPKLFEYYMREDIRGYLSDSNPVHPLRDIVVDADEERTREKANKKLEEYTKKMSKLNRKKRKI